MLNFAARLLRTALGNWKLKYDWQDLIMSILLQRQKMRNIHIVLYFLVLIFATVNGQITGMQLYYLSRPRLLPAAGYYFWERHVEVCALFLQLLQCLCNSLQRWLQDCLQRQWHHHVFILSLNTAFLNKH